MFLYTSIWLDLKDTDIICIHTFFLGSFFLKEMLFKNKEEKKIMFYFKVEGIHCEQQYTTYIIHYNLLFVISISISSS